MVKIEPDVSYVSLDTETTGFKPSEGHRIVELGAVEFRNGILTGRHYHAYLNPERTVGDSFNVHKLSDEFLAEKPLFEEVADSFLEFLGDCPLVIHNSEFDLSFLDAEYARLKRPVFRKGRTVIDTLREAQRRYPRAQHSLDALCDRLKVDRSRREKGHGALLDSELLAEMAMKMFGVWGLSHAFGTKETVVAVQAAGKIALQPRAVIVSAPSEAEMARHDAFVAKLKNPIWKATAA
ncbi:DNA polymerase-3 subunit epsilon [Bradyrhizobium sp. USDA 4341]